MPTTTATASAPTVSVRDGLACLLEWLNSHPAIPIAYIDFADDATAEMQLPAGRFDALAGAAVVADALDGAEIKVSDPPQKRITEITVLGTVSAGSGTSVAVTVTATVYDDARARLLSSLGVPVNPAARCWYVTAGHLRGLVDHAPASAVSA